MTTLNNSRSIAVPIQPQAFDWDQCVVTEMPSTEKNGEMMMALLLLLVVSGLLMHLL